MRELSAEEEKNILKQFKGRQIAMLLSSVLLIFMGIIFLLVSAADDNTTGQIIIFTVSGIALLGLGGWGISLSKRQTFQIPRAEILVYETKLGLIAAWCFYLVGILGIVGALVTGCAGEKIFWFCSVLSLMVLFLTIFMFSDYRKRMITMTGNTILGVNAWGRSYTFQKSDIGKISLTIGGSYLVRDRYGKKLLRFESNMAHADKLFNRLEVKKYAAWYEPDLCKRQQAERLEWNHGDETWQTMYITEIKRLFHLLVILNTVLTFVLLLCLNTYIKLKYRLFLIELQPLVYAGYAWIFNEVAIWQPLRDVNASEDWKKKHFSMVPAYVHTFVIFLIFTTGIMEDRVNIIRYEWKYLLCILFLFLILIFITGMRIRIQKNKGAALVCAIFFSAIISLGIVPGALLASNRQTIHYPAEIVNTRKTGGARRGTYYSATVILSDGSQTSIDISKYNYEEIRAGKEKVVCENEGMLGIKFVNIHDPADTAGSSI